MMVALHSGTPLYCQLPYTSGARLAFVLTTTNAGSLG